MVTVGGGQASGGGGVIAKGSGYGVGLNRSSFHPNRFKPRHAVEQHQVRLIYTDQYTQSPFKGSLPTFFTRFDPYFITNFN